jgi:hypothetical protein
VKRPGCVQRPENDGGALDDPELEYDVAADPLNSAAGPRPRADLVDRQVGDVVVAVVSNERPPAERPCQRAKIHVHPPLPKVEVHCSRRCRRVWAYDGGRVHGGAWTY